MKKLVLVVIDAMRPEMLQRAIDLGDAPTLGRLARDGFVVHDCTSSFPSLTPVASSTITTGRGPDLHHVPSMNWFHRRENRYVEYGTSFHASRRAGLINVLEDLVYNLNEQHLNREVPTFFETLDEAGLRTACTTFMIYRGPHKHAHVGGGFAGTVAAAAGLARPAHGPKELLYADIFDSLGSECRSRFGTPGQRDQHSACVARQLIEEDRFDFLLLSFPDNDTYSHRNGPEGQVVSIAHADEQLAAVMHASGGYKQFMEDHAVIVLSDHSQIGVGQSFGIDAALEEWPVLELSTRARTRARRKGMPAPKIALSPAARTGMVYLLDQSPNPREAGWIAERLTTVPAVDQAMYLLDGEAVIRNELGELHFAPGSGATDARGASWSLDGSLDVVDLRLEDSQLCEGDYPDALGRVWSALNCPNSGDVICTADKGWEFLDWGGADHVGGGSHGSLHSDDSEAQLIITGTAEAAVAKPRRWSISDVYDLVLEHFGLHDAADAGL